MSDKIKIASIIAESIVDGPGLRLVVFTQGCYHKCPGCHNPDTHDPNKGKLVDIEDILDKICNNPLLDGVTFSGGEPFLQADALGTLGIKIKEKRPELNIITYTGYTFEELQDYVNRTQSLSYLKLLRVTDFLIDGKFEEDKKSLDIKFRGSTNQRYLNMKESLKRQEPVNVPEEEI